MLFNSDKLIAILANKASIAGEIFQKVRIAYERLPYWMQVGVVEWQKTSCTLENGSKCFSVATTEDGIRGLTCNVLFLDEFAFVKRGIADGFFTSVYPTISASKESKIIMVSTPNGLNHFHNIWQKAVAKKNTFAPFRVDWWEVPGRDEQWKIETIRNMGQVKFNQEYGNVFLGSTNTLIRGEILEMLDAKEPLRSDTYGRYYDEVKPEHVYVFGVDTAKGTGGDYSVVNILDITKLPFRQVGVYRNNGIGTRPFGIEVVNLAKQWNNAWIMVENNDIGAATVDYIWHDAEYENLVNWSPKFKANEIGIRSTKQTKSAGNDLLKQLIENNKVDIVDQDTIYELSKYIEVDILTPGIFRGEDNENDDCVTSLLWGLFFTKTSFFDGEEDLYSMVPMTRPSRTGDEEDTGAGMEMPSGQVDGFGM